MIAPRHFCELLLTTRKGFDLSNGHIAHTTHHSQAATKKQENPPYNLDPKLHPAGLMHDAKDQTTECTEKKRNDSPKSARCFICDHR